MSTAAPAMRHVVIVGGSVAAVTAADAARGAGFDGEITMLTDEDHLPYVRPPLSKAVLSGVESPDSVFISPLRSDLTVRTGTRAVGLDADRKRVLLAGGEELGYDGLIIATGARARRLTRDPGELVVRDLDDAIALRERLLTNRRMVVVGGGFLGMEVASTARKLGLAVTVLDAAPHLVRQFGPLLADLMCSAAIDAGVRLIRCPEGAKLAGEPVGAVRTGDGRLFEADVVVSAVGCQPNVEWLLGSRICDPGGVLVDDRCRVAASVASIVAAGDVATRPHPAGSPRRTPHWNSAIEQARTAAAALVQGDAAEPLRPRPYFWTEQWGLEIKVCGEMHPQAVPHVILGSLAERELVVQWTLGGAAVAAASVNHRMPIAKLRKLATAAPVAA